MDNTSISEVIEAEFPSTALAVLKPAKLPAVKKAKFKSKHGVTTYASDKHVGQVRFKGMEKVTANGKAYDSRQFTTFTAAKEWVRDETKRLKDLLKAKTSGFAAKVGTVPLDMPVVEMLDLYVTMYPEKMPPLANGQRATLPEGTVGYFDRLKAHPVIKPAKLGHVNVDLMRDYCEARLAEGVKNTSINSEFGYFGRALKMVTRWKKWGAFAPLAGAKAELTDEGKVTDTEARVQVPTNQNLSDLINWYAARDARMMLRKGKTMTRLADFIEFQATQGTRLGEGIEMELRHLIEKADGTATIALWRKDSDAEQNVDTMTRRRWVDAMPLVERAYEILKQQPSYIAWKALSVKERKQSTLRLFPYDASTMGKIWRKARADCDCTHLHQHDLRAKAITELVRVMPITDVMKFSGHRTIKALQIYVRHVEDDLSAMSKRTAGIRLNITREAANSEQIKVAA